MTSLRITLMSLTLWLAACGPMPLPVPGPNIPDEPGDTPVVRGLADGVPRGLRRARDAAPASARHDFSRAAQPLLVLLSNGKLQARALDTGAVGRHAQLLSVELATGRVLAGGLFDAPMTHSGDGQGPEPMSHGALTLTLRP